MQPYIIVLAGSTQEASKYVRRADLPRGRWRIAASAASIRGIRRAHIHALPSFHDRRDSHSVLAELRYARCEWFDVEMPAPSEAPPVDQGDGMGEQLTIDDALEHVGVMIEQENSLLTELAEVADDEKVTKAVQAKIEHNEEVLKALDDNDPVGFLSDNLDEDELPTEEELKRVRHEVAEERRAKAEPTPDPEEADSAAMAEGPRHPEAFEAEPKRQPKPRRPAGSSPRARVAPKPAPPVTNLFD